jgi:SAM-dependent methyltransferase
MSKQVHKYTSIYVTCIPVYVNTYLPVHHICIYHSLASRYNERMEKRIAEQLLQLNAEFYQTFAVQFSDTRQRIQPGVRQILNALDPHAQILDLGCGNGELARELLRRDFRGSYLGLDFSTELLEVAREGLTGHSHFAFIQGNLGQPDWPSAIHGQRSDFDTIFAFAALHHLPGRETHLQILHNVQNLLTPAGRFIHSNWQFLNSERLCQRIHPWDEIGLSDADIDSGDYLLDWRRGGFGLRYVHHFSAEELQSLANETGFRVAETFHSDGETGDLGLYQIWEKVL